jgi:hypothetical protein
VTRGLAKSKRMTVSARSLLLLVLFAISAISRSNSENLSSAALRKTAAALPGVAISEEESQKIYDRGLEPVIDEPGLPRVLLIGDSISVYYTSATRRLLKGKANLHRIPTNGKNTGFGLENIDGWLGTAKWDVIHFNWGLHDLGMNANGKQTVPLEQYRANLQELVRRLKRTGAVLVWATTTPVPDHIEKGPERHNRDAIAYNAAALQIMREDNIQIDDLYGFVLPRLKELELPDDVHFSVAGSDALAGQVADSILQALAAAQNCETHSACP